MPQSEKSFSRVLVILASLALLGLAGFILLRTNSTGTVPAEKSIHHHFLLDRFSVTFNESVTAPQAAEIAKQMGFSVIESHFTKVILKAELQDGWSQTTIDLLKSHPGVLEASVISWKKPLEKVSKNDPPTYGMCYVKSRKKELVFVHFANGTTASDIQTIVRRLEHLKVLEIEESPNELILSCSSEKTEDAIELFEATPQVRYAAFLTELVSN